MATINELLQQEANPFDPVSFKTGNFWQEQDTDIISSVNSIHQEAIDEITQLLNLVAKDHHTRTVLLAGDAGSGKSFVLKRLKSSLNSKAFFVYIPPFVDNEYIWRHTLRQTVDSLMHKPEGQQESQLLLWLKSLSVFSDRSLLKKLFGERNLFISNLKSAYPIGVHQAKDFFGALYDLNHPDLYLTACSWLRGDDLDEEDLKALKINKSIDSEAAAQGILANFGKISASTYPIVLCFDQVESKQLPNGSADIQPVFNINTSFHNERLENFLIIISIVTNIWRQNSSRIEQSDKDRIEKPIILKPISLDQAEFIWASRLSSIYHQAKPQPETKIYPLARNILEEKYPGGKTTPRKALILAHQLLHQYKLESRSDIPDKVYTQDIPASFKLLWEQEFSQTSKKVARIRHFSEPELISMLQRALSALQIKNIQPRLLTSKTYASYSFSYQAPHKNQKQGLVWAENPSKTFHFTMKSCVVAEEAQTCQGIYLVRAEGPGRPNTIGYKLYKKLFLDSPHNRHIKPDLESVHYLATYNRLVNSVLSQELVVAGKTLDLDELESLVRSANIFQDCYLLQDISVFPQRTVSQPSFNREKDFLLNFIRTHYLVARRVVTQAVIGQFPKLSDAEVQQLIQELIQEKQIKILDESVRPDEQIICLIPQQ